MLAIFIPSMANSAEADQFIRPIPINKDTGVYVGHKEIMQGKAGAISAGHWQYLFVRFEKSTFCPQICRIRITLGDLFFEGELLENKTLFRLEPRNNQGVQEVPEFEVLSPPSYPLQLAYFGTNQKDLR